MGKLVSIMFIALFILSCNEDSKVNDLNTIKFWHFWSEPYQVKVIDSLVKKFEEKYNVKVEMTELSWNDGKTKLFAAFSSNTAPDVLELGSDWVAQFSSAGVLDEFTTKDIDMNKYIDFATAPSYYQNKVYALPWIVDTRVLFYNEQLLYKVNGKVEPPHSFDSLLILSERINNIENMYGFGANGSDKHRLYKKIVSMFWSYGGDILNSKGEPVVNSPENIKAMNMYLDLSRNGIIETQRQLDAVFTEGKLGFLISGGWLIEKIKNENPNLSYHVTPIPNSTDKNGVSFAGGEYLAISAKSTNKQLAKDFAKYMTDGINSIEFCKRIVEAGFPADKNYFNDEFYKSAPRRMVFAEQLKNAKMTPVHPKWLDIENIIEEATVEVLYGKKNATVALNDAQNSIVNLLKSN
ncbi:MAG TPA: extracellular solute-binding protein [Candidatus Kapabacteria bacterium]|nr:extracellular solute-binding protein [Candidatus Kapabacteria bacterium]